MGCPRKFLTYADINIFPGLRTKTGVLHWSLQAASTHVSPVEGWEGGRWNEKQLRKEGSAFLDILNLSRNAHRTAVFMMIKVGGAA